MMLLRDKSQSVLSMALALSVSVCRVCVASAKE